MASIPENIVRGEWILTNHTVQTVDSFSWSMAGEPWQNSESLADVLFTLAYRASGWAGDVLLVAIAMSTTGLVI
jgi:hypothetical protein